MKTLMHIFIVWLGKNVETSSAYDMSLRDYAHSHRTYVSTGCLTVKKLCS